MTVPSTPLRKEHTLTGTIVPLLYDWQAVSETDLLVTLVDTSITPNDETPLILGVDYSVTGINDPNGGNIVPNFAYTAGWKIVITTSLRYEQDTNFTNQNSVLPSEVTRMADKIVRQIKQLAEQVSRSVKTTVGSSLTPDHLITLIKNAAVETENDKNAAAASAQSASDAAASAAAAAAVLPLNNYSATSDPAPVNDITQGYSPGSSWTNVTTGDRFRCRAATQGAAIWDDVTGIDVSDLGSMAFKEVADFVATAEIPTVRSIPQNSKATAYTLVLGDAAGHILHPSSDVSARIYTIPDNASVAFPIGTAITFVNQNGAGILTISIAGDTMRMAGSGATGNRTLAANGLATALKLTATEWIISGTNLT